MDIDRVKGVLLILALIGMLGLIAINQYEISEIKDKLNPQQQQH